MASETFFYPQACPHCGKSIAHLRPVAARVLDAARALLHDGNQTSRDVAKALDIKVSHASMLLHRACVAALIAKTARRRSHTSGGAEYEYTPSKRLKAYAPLEYRLWEREQHNAPRKLIA